MCTISTGHAQAFLSASDMVVLQKVADGKISIQSAYTLNTWYISISHLLETESIEEQKISYAITKFMDQLAKQLLFIHSIILTFPRFMLL
jgi:hypothetical protein